MPRLFPLLTLLLLSTFTQAATITDLRCETRHNPTGIDAPHPRLSWLMQSDQRGDRQTAYQIIVTTSNQPLWDSGKISSDQSVHIPYTGLPLISEMSCQWKVRIWDKSDHPSDWSAPASWTMGLLTVEDWKGPWIADKNKNACPWLRKTFKLATLPDEAVAYTAFLGYGELYINGRKVGDDVLAPAISNLHRRAFYITRDIRPYLRTGSNCVALWLAQGWNTPGKPTGVTEISPLAHLQLNMQWPDHRQNIISDASWKSAPSCITRIGHWGWQDYGGESIDNRLMIDAWADPDFDDRNWAPVQTIANVPLKLESQPGLLNRIGEKIPAVRCDHLSDGSYVIDFGVNLTGWMDLPLPNLKSGQVVTIKYADRSFPATPAPDAAPGMYNTGTGFQTMNQEDVFISTGKPGESFCSRFNYHGFRFAIISGLDSPPDWQQARALLIETDLESAGQFECSDALFNRLHKVNVQTLRCLDLGGYMVDCPHRERLGYGDAQTSIDSCIMNFRMDGFYEKWAADWCDSQNPSTGELPHSAPTLYGGGGPAWGGLMYALAMRPYLYYGDLQPVQNTYPAMQPYLDWLDTRCKNNILRAYGGSYDFLGDWVAPGRGQERGGVWPSTLDNEFFNNCYRIKLLMDVRQAAQLLGKSDDADRCLAKIQTLQPLIQREFYDPSHKNYVTDDQVDQVMPLLVGVTPSDLHDQILSKLVSNILVRRQGHLDTGMLGTYFMIQYLQDIDRSDLIFTFAHQTTYPSWGYMLAQGATTNWEQWNGAHSHIHSTFDSLDSWFYQAIAGIRFDPDAPGFKKIIIHPTLVGDLTWAKAHYDSQYGRIVTDWNKKAGRFTLHVVIPPNTTATIFIPTDNPASILESNHPAAQSPTLTFLRMENTAALYHADSGVYDFTSQLLN